MKCPDCKYSEMGGVAWSTDWNYIDISRQSPEVQAFIKRQPPETHYHYWCHRHPKKVRVGEKHWCGEGVTK